MADKAASGFVWYELMTGDLDKAVKFYGSVVGWDVRDSGMPGMRYMMFGKDGKDVGGMMSWKDMGEDRPTKWEGHIGTGDLDAEVEAVVADGGTEFRPPTEIPGVGRFAVVGDPQGAVYMLFEPMAGYAAPARLRAMEVGAVGWHELLTTDWEKAWEFYSGHYGWTKDMAVDMGPMGTYQTFKVDGAAYGGGMVTLPPERAPQGAGPIWLYYFTVEDIQAAAGRVKDAGGSLFHGPMQVPGGSWILQGIDNQGGTFALSAAR